MSHEPIAWLNWHFRYRLTIYSMVLPRNIKIIRWVKQFLCMLKYGHFWILAYFDATFNLWTWITNEPLVRLSKNSRCTLGLYGSVNLPKTVCWMNGTVFMSTQKLGIFSIFLGKKNFWARILEKPLLEVKIYSEAYQWWHFDKKNLFQKVFLKKFGIRPKQNKISKIHNSLVFYFFKT